MHTSSKYICINDYKKEEDVNIEEKRIYNEEELAELLTLSIHTIRSRRCRNKDLPRSFKVGNRIMTIGSEILKWINDKGGFSDI